MRRRTTGYNNGKNRVRQGLPPPSAQRWAQGLRTYADMKSLYKDYNKQNK